MASAVIYWSLRSELVESTPLIAVHDVPPSVVSYTWFVPTNNRCGLVGSMTKAFWEA